jgi:hypothetical protein
MVSKALASWLGEPPQTTRLDKNHMPIIDADAQTPR